MGEPFFLSNIYMLERSAVVPFTSSQVRGVSRNLPQQPHECPLLCEGHTELVSDPCPRTQKARSCGWHKEWAQLVGHGHTARAAGTRMYRRGLGSAHHRAGVGSLACLLLLPRGAYVPWRPFRGTGQKTLAGRGQVCSGVPSSKGKRVVSDHSKETAGENPRNEVSLQNPRSVFWREKVQAHQVLAPDCGSATSVVPSLPPDVSLFHPTGILRESEAGGK